MQSSIRRPRRSDGTGSPHEESIHMLSDSASDCETHSRNSDNLEQVIDAENKKDESICPAVTNARRAEHQEARKVRFDTVVTAPPVKYSPRQSRNRSPPIRLSKLRLIHKMKGAVSEALAPSKTTEPVIVSSSLESPLTLKPSQPKSILKMDTYRQESTKMTNTSSDTDNQNSKGVVNVHSDTENQYFNETIDVSRDNFAQKLTTVVDLGSDSNYGKRSQGDLCASTESNSVKPTKSESINSELDNKLVPDISRPLKPFRFDPDCEDQVNLRKFLAKRRAKNPEKYPYPPRPEPPVPKDKDSPEYVDWLKGPPPPPTRLCEDWSYDWDEQLSAYNIPNLEERQKKSHLEVPTEAHQVLFKYEELEPGKYLRYRSTGKKKNGRWEYKIDTIGENLGFGDLDGSGGGRKRKEETIEPPSEYQVWLKKRSPLWEQYAKEHPFPGELEDKKEDVTHVGKGQAEEEEPGKSEETEYEKRQRWKKEKAKLAQWRKRWETAKPVQAHQRGRTRQQRVDNWQRDGEEFIDWDREYGEMTGYYGDYETNLNEYQYRTSYGDFSPTNYAGSHQSEDEVPPLVFGGRSRDRFLKSDYAGSEDEVPPLVFGGRSQDRFLVSDYEGSDSDSTPRGSDIWERRSKAEGGQVALGEPTYRPNFEHKASDKNFEQSGYNFTS